MNFYSIMVNSPESRDSRRGSVSDSTSPINSKTLTSPLSTPKQVCDFSVSDTSATPLRLQKAYKSLVFSENKRNKHKINSKKSINNNNVLHHPNTFFNYNMNDIMIHNNAKCSSCGK